MPRRTRPLLGWLCVAAVLAAGAVVALPAVAAEDTLTPERRQVAETIYANQCATCHGSDGQGRQIPGTDREGPPLADTDEVTVPYVDLTLRVGRMPPPENEPFDNRERHVVVSDEDREALVLYLAEQFDLQGEIPEVGEGDPVRGREIYAANCAQCHGSTGAGGVAGAGAWTPPLVDRDPVTVAEAIRVGPFEMPAFAPEQIDDQGIDDIVAFLRVLAEEHGTPLGLTELNPVFASGFAFLFALVVLLSALWIAGRPTMFPDIEEEPAVSQDAPQRPEGTHT